MPKGNEPSGNEPHVLVTRTLIVQQLVPLRYYPGGTPGDARRYETELPDEDKAQALIEAMELGDSPLRSRTISVRVDELDQGYVRKQYAKVR